jgi:hypothetical protein
LNKAASAGSTTAGAALKGFADFLVFSLDRSVLLLVRFFAIAENKLYNALMNGVRSLLFEAPTAEENPLDVYRLIGVNTSRGLNSLAPR